jgi:hypothetical protein
MCHHEPTRNILLDSIRLVRQIKRLSPALNELNLGLWDGQTAFRRKFVRARLIIPGEHNVSRPDGAVSPHMLGI